MTRHDPPGPTPPPNPGGPGREDYLTVLQVAELLNVDKNTVYELVYSNSVAWVDLRRQGAQRARIRIRRSAVHDFMSARERPAVVA